MVNAADIIGDTRRTDAFLEEMRRSHKARLRKAIRNLEDKMIDQMAGLSAKGGRLEGIKINLKQSQKIHSKMIRIFEEEYGQTVSRMVGEYGQIATHIKRSWRSLGEAIHYTDIDKAMLTSLQNQTYEQFSVFGEAAQRRMADAMYSSVVAGASYAQLLKSVRGILKGHTDVTGRSMLLHANTHAFDAIMNFHNDVNVKKSEDLGIKKFMYVGDVMITTRQFCRVRAGNVYTKRQIESWNNRRWAGKSGPAFTHRGGYNCRHHWRGMKDDWMEVSDEVGAGLTPTPLKAKRKVVTKPRPKPKAEPKVIKRREPKKLPSLKKVPKSFTDTLEKGKVSGTSEVEVGGVNTTEIKTLKYKGTTVKGAFKPLSGEAFQGLQGSEWEPYLYLKKCPQAYREVMSSAIDEALDLGLVPKTIMRKLDGELGSLQLWVSDAKIARDVMRPIVKIAPKEAYKTTILDYVTGNVDRHHGNWLVNAKTGKISMIDNGLSFISSSTNPRSRLPSWYDKVMNPKEETLQLARAINGAFNDEEKEELIERLKSLDIKAICGGLSRRELNALKRRIKFIIPRIRGNTIGNLMFSKRLNAG